MTQKRGIVMDSCRHRILTFVLFSRCIVNDYIHLVLTNVRIISIYVYFTLSGDMSDGSAHHIVHDVLQFHKVSARWVPLQLTAELKERRVDDCQELLKRFEAEGDGFLERTVMGDETWVHYHQPETKKASKEWRHTSSPKPKKFRTQPSAG